MERDIVNFLFEAGVLKRVRRGWYFEGVDDPETVADHSFRAAIVGFVLAKMEKADSDKVVKMMLFHDLTESRIGDITRVARRYLAAKNEEQVNFEQTENLPSEIKDEIRELFDEYEQRKSKEATIAKDADILELILQAKEYSDAGYIGCDYWIEKNSEFLKTESARTLFDQLKKGHSTEWWKGLQKLG